MRTKTISTGKRPKELEEKRKITVPRFLLCLPLVLLPLLLGGARPWFWSCIAGIFAVGLTSLIWTSILPWRTENIGKRYLVGLGLLLLYPLFQAVSLSASWVAYLSPQHMLWKENAINVAMAPSRFFTISYAPLITFFAALWWIFLAAYALLLRRALREDSDLSWLYHTLFWVAGIEAFYGLLQTLSPSLGVLWESPGQGVARGTFVNRNHYAAFLGMLWPVLLAYLFTLKTASETGVRLSHRELEQQKKTRQKSWFLGFVIGLVLLGLFFSQSRGGIMGALIAFTIFIAFGKIGYRKRMVVFLVGCWVIMLAYGSIIGFDEILARFDQLEKADPGRFNIWKDSWRLIQDHWVTGTGLGTYPEVIRIYQSYLTDQFDIVHAHNDYLELAADLGIPVAAMMVLSTWGYWSLSALRVASKGKKGTIEERVRDLNSGNRSGFLENEQMRERKLLAVGALAGSAAFLFQSWVEFNWQIPANQIYFLLLLLLMNLRPNIRLLNFSEDK
jgi:O-antigen ligase